MSKIRTLFDETRPIDRLITSIINYSGDSEDQLEREIREYEITDNLARHYERFMSNLSDGFQSGDGHEIGVWVSGFYGSGKSSFTKYLGFALDPARKIKGEPFLKWLQNQFTENALRAQLATLAARFPATVIMLDLAAVASAQAGSQGVSRLLYWKVMEWAGYSKDEKLALLELLLERDGKLESFKKRFQEVAKGYTWEALKNDLLVGVTYASRIASEFYPGHWPDAKAFNDTKVDSRYGEDERVKQMLEVIERRTGSPRALFIIDEVGQFIEGMPGLILNMQGLAENLKNLSNGQAWLIATAQQTLPVTGPLFKLKDRFPEPLRVDIESSDIREITYRRLLRKSTAGRETLEKLFKDCEGALNHATQLKNTKLLQTDLSAETFVRLYPFLPQHFNILMELLRSLARSTGGIGLRSAIKVIQDVLVDVSGYRTGQKLLADASVNTLATADIFFDSLRRDLERANRQLVETVDHVCDIWGEDSLHGRVAKTIVVLQLIDGFPVSRHNVAALLHPGLKVAPIWEDVGKAVDDMLGEKGLPLVEIDGSLRFMSAAVSQIMGEMATLLPSSTDSHRIIGERLREILSPEPSALVEHTLKVKAQLKLVQGSMPIALTHDKCEVEMHLELVRANELQSTIDVRTNDSRQVSNQNIIYLCGEDSTQIRDLVKEIYQTEEIHLRHRTEAEKEVAEFIRAQAQRAETLKRDLDSKLQDGFMKGGFVFRGKPQAVATRGTELLNACKQQLNLVAADVFNRYKEAPIPTESGLAEKLLQTKDLTNIPSANDPLGLVVKKGAATAIDANRAALVSLFDYLKGKSTVDGRKLLDDFSRAPFGWSKDTTRYLAAALLIAGKIRLRVGAQWIKVPGEKAIEAFKSNVAFGKVDVATNDETISQDALLRAAKRLLDATGDQVLPMPQNISRCVQEHFPKFQRDYASLSAQLSGSSIPGAERAERLAKQLSQILQSDGSEAPAVLGAEESELMDNLGWAREVRKAFEQRLNETVREAHELLREIPKLPRVGAAEALIKESETARDELGDFLSREDFFRVGADIRNGLQSLGILVRGAAENLTEQFRKNLDAQRDSICGSENWHALPEGDRSQFSGELDVPSFDDAVDLDGIRRLLNKRIEVDALMHSIRGRVEARAKQIEEEKKKESDVLELAPGNEAEPGGGETIPQTVIVKIRSSYSSSVEIQQLITELQNALAKGGSVTFELH